MKLVQILIPGLVAASLLICPAGADPQALGSGLRLIDMPVRMTISSLAKVRSTALDFWYPEDVIDGQMPIPSGTQTKAREIRVRGELVLDRSVAMTAIITPPDLPVIISCPGGSVEIGPFTATGHDDEKALDCSQSGTTTCSFNIGGVARMSRAMTPVACTAGSATFTIQYQ